MIKIKQWWQDLRDSGRILLYTIGALDLPARLDWYRIPNRAARVTPSAADYHALQGDVAAVGADMYAALEQQTALMEHDPIAAAAMHKARLRSQVISTANLLAASLTTDAISPGMVSERVNTFHRWVNQLPQEDRAVVLEQIEVMHGMTASLPFLNLALHSMQIYLEPRISAP